MPELDLSDRNPMVAAVRAIVAALYPRLRYVGDHEYAVASQDGNFVDLRPVDTQAGLPQLTKIPFRGAPGVSAEVKAGCKVVVRFVNSDPGRPYVVAVEGRHESSFVPTTVRIDATGTAYVGESSSMVEVAGGSQFVAVKNLTENRFLQLYLAISTAPVVSGDGGASFKGSILSTLGLAGWSNTGVPSVAATKVKVT